MFLHFRIVYPYNTKYNEFMQKYPDFVRAFKPKGTIAKKKGGVFYVYEATSKRVAGKSYPVQVVGPLLGRVDASGFHRNEAVTIDLASCRIREYGFTDYLLLFSDSFAAKRPSPMTREESLGAFRAYIAFLSPSSYLADGKLPTPKELTARWGLSTSQQIKGIMRMIEPATLEEIDPLKSLFLITDGRREAKSLPTPAQRALLLSLGVKGNG